MDEKEKNEILRKSEELEIPESLEPENMMKQLKLRKECDKKKEDKDNLVNRKNKFVFWKINPMAAGMVAVAFVLIAGIFANSYLSSNSILDKNISTDKNSEKLENQQTETDNISLDNNKDNIEPIGDREEVIKLGVDYWLKIQENLSGNKFYDEEFGLISEESATNEIEINADDTVGNPPQTSDGNQDYYENNDQVKGVAEPDVVLTDGKYIYSLNKSETKIDIVSCDNGKMDTVSSILFDEELGDSIEFKDMGNILYEEEICYDIAYLAPEVKFNVTGDALSIVITDYVNTVVLGYDISDRAKPVFKAKTEIDGRMVSSRVSDDYLYVITDYCMRNVDFSVDDIENEDVSVIVEERVKEWFIPKVNGQEIEADSIFKCTGQEDYNRFVVVTSIDINDSFNVKDKLASIGGSYEIYVSRENIYTVNTRYEYDFANRSTKNYTDIFKFKYDKGIISSYASGTVDGYVSEQFSLDENNGYLRVVSSVLERDDISVYVLDDALKVVGELEGIVSGEQFMSAKYVDDKLYFVSFLRKDPLFVIDLSEPENPHTVNQLDVSGFSSYLHHWGNNMLLGIGFEADEDTGIVTGTKLSLFDTTSDNLKEISKKVYDKSYPQFENTGYKGILVDERKNIIGLGMTSEVYDSDGVGELSCEYVVLQIDNKKIKEVFKYKGELDEEYRGLFIGDYLYIVDMDKGIQSVNLKDFSLVQFMDF